MGVGEYLNFCPKGPGREKKRPARPSPGRPPGSLCPSRLVRRRFFQFLHAVFVIFFHSATFFPEISRNSLFTFPRVRYNEGRTK